MVARRNYITRLTALICIGLFASLGGCASNGAGGWKLGADKEPSFDFIQVTKKGRTKCYTRVQGGTPVDQICQKGDYVRYSPDVEDFDSFSAIPEYVLALFGTMERLESNPHLSAYVE